MLLLDVMTGLLDSAKLMLLLDVMTGLLDSAKLDGKLGEGDGDSPDEVVDPINDELSISVELPPEPLLSDELETVVLEATSDGEALDVMLDESELCSDGEALDVVLDESELCADGEALGVVLDGSELCSELLAEELITEDDTVDVAIAVESGELCVDKAPEDVVVAGAWK
jgi:hypothetical protein